MRYADVIVDLSAEAVDRTFTYALPDMPEVDIGWQVEVPFGPRTLEGFIVRVHEDCDLPPEKVRPVRRAVYDYPTILPELIELAHWMHDRYLCNLVDTLRLMLPAQMRGQRVHIKTRRMARLLWTKDRVEGFIRENRRAKAQARILTELLRQDAEASTLSGEPLRELVRRGAVVIVEEQTRRAPHVMKDERRSVEPELMSGQRAAVEEITAALQNGGGRFLLNGVTGSGKTEVYIRTIRRALELKKTAVVLVPEIALTPQMVAWLHARFGADAAVLHSGLSVGERYDEWRRIRFGEARVVIGARSAVFAPVQDLGVIVVDEEHESSYRSDRRPCYDAREVAWHRAQANGAVLVLGSATPSISSYMRVLPSVRPENRLTLVELRERVKRRPLPQVDIVDMRQEFERGNTSIFSAKLSAALRRCLDAGQQAVLFLNRRGYSTYVSCRKCGHVVKCGRCDVSMTYHRSDDRLRCHYCGSETEPPKLCPECGSRYIKYFGVGTQRVEEEVRLLFPDARTVRVDVDTTQEKDAHARLLETFASGRANVMIGTQMIAKGLDFPKVTLVGVVAADMSLNLPDYRSAERTFQLITQVAGRAGRAELPGRVILQTYEPEHYAITLAAAQDYRAFYTRESEYRRRALYPPFTVIARIVYSGKDQEAVKAAATDGETELKKWLEAAGAMRDIVQVRALEAPIGRIDEHYRWQLFLKMYFKGDSEAVTRRMRALADAAPQGVRAELEVNPNSLF